MRVIVDPFDRNIAIVDGKRAWAVWAVPPIPDPAAPRAGDLQGGKIVGYSADFGSA